MAENTTRKRRRKRRRQDRTCETCGECMYIGEGDSICSADVEPKLIVDDFVPSDDYFWCGGEKWERE